MANNNDTANAFIDRFELEAENGAGGVLAGMRLGVKDIYDLEGKVTGCGNPEWARTHGPASATAPTVDMLLAAGARIVGKTHTDELAYSLIGANAHYGTPLNSAAPERVPGGSSSGSAAATAAGSVEIGLGSDTGGSVRLPASFCGIYGIRTTHGRIPLDGIMPLAPSFDTVGWFARDTDTMMLAAKALGVSKQDGPPGPLLLPVDAWAEALPDTVSALAPTITRLQTRYHPVMPIVLAADGLSAWAEVFRICQASEIWSTHGEWIEKYKPAFGPGVRDRFAMAKGITADTAAAANAERQNIRTAIHALLRDNAVLVMPTSPEPAPLKSADEAALAAFRTRALAMLCPAGLAGLPQISIPAGTVDGAPVGLSLIGAPGTDGMLLSLVRALDVTG